MKNKETKFVAPNQNLFNTLQNVANFTALQSDMQEIIDSVDRDRQKTNLTNLRRKFTKEFSTFLAKTKQGRRGINPYISVDGVFDWFLPYL